MNKTYTLIDEVNVEIRESQPDVVRTVRIDDLEAEKIAMEAEIATVNTSYTTSLAELTKKRDELASHIAEMKKAGAKTQAEADALKAG